MPANHVKVEHDFTLPVERVFAYLAEHTNLGTLFGLKVEHIKDGDTSRSGAGSVRRLSVGGKLPFEETVTKDVPNELIEYRISKGSPLKNHFGRMVFSSLPSGGTHLTYTIDFDGPAPGLGKVVAMGLQNSISRGLKKVDSKA